VHRQKPPAAHWLIQGFDGLSKTHEWRIDAHNISEKNLQLLLRALVAKAGLTLDEIVGAHVNRRARLSNGLLHVSRDGPRLRFTCGDNPYFVADYRRAAP